MKPMLITDAAIIGTKKLFVKDFRDDHYNHPFHFHNLIELTLVKKGFGKLIVGDHVSSFSEGELILLGDRLPHMFQCDPSFYAEKKLRTESTTLYFSSAILTNVIDDEEATANIQRLLSNAGLGVRFYAETRNLAIPYIEEIRHKRGLEQLASFLQLIAQLCRFTGAATLATPGNNVSYDLPELKRFNQVYQFLLKNFRQDVTLDEVSSICNLTPAAFSRYFKQKTQKTFIRFLNEIRIGHACKLLQNEAVPLKSIGADCGFNNETNFFKTFKVITGKTPLLYRRDFNTMSFGG
jgi:AraC-like DNA-binding protein